MDHLVDAEALEPSPSPFLSVFLFLFLSVVEECRMEVWVECSDLQTYYNLLQHSGGKMRENGKRGEIMRKNKRCTDKKCRREEEKKAWETEEK